MSGTKRTPLERRSATQITPKAIELFRELERAKRARRRAIDCRISEHGCCSSVSECRACSRWWDLHNELHIELALPPWRWPAIPKNPFPPNSRDAREWRPNTEQRELWNLLDAARRAATATETARKKGDTNAEPNVDQDAPV
jgi:hypothetical protein